MLRVVQSLLAVILVADIPLLLYLHTQLLRLNACVSYHASKTPASFHTHKTIFRINRHVSRHTSMAILSCRNSLVAIYACEVDFHTHHPRKQSSKRAPSQSTRGPSHPKFRAVSTNTHSHNLKALQYQHYPHYHPHLSCLPLITGAQLSEPTE